MEFRFNLKGEQRKKLVLAISDTLNTPLKYLGAPSFAYKVGGYHIDKDGTVTGEYSLPLFARLEELGFSYETDKTYHLITPRGTLLIREHFTTADEAKKAGYSIYFSHKGRDIYTKPSGTSEHGKHFAVVGEPFGDSKNNAETDKGDNSLCIDFPITDFSEKQIDNLKKMVLSKEVLIKKALGIETLPIEISEDKISFPWFENNGNAESYAQFISCLCKTAKEKSRVNFKETESFENEKFSMRVWLISLGMVGKEYCNARKLLCKNLSGNSAFRNGKPEKDTGASDE